MQRFCIVCKACTHQERRRCSSTSPPAEVPEVRVASPARRKAHFVWAFVENCIASQLHLFPPFFLPQTFFYPFLRPFRTGWGEAPPVFFTPPQTREMLRHIDDVDTCILSVCLSFLLACFLSFVFACSVLVYTSSPVSSLPHCATFIPLIFLLGNGPPRREDCPTAISNADVCKQMLAGNEECS